MSFFLLFLIGSVSAQYTSAPDGDLCFDPDSQETSTSGYANSTISATKTASSTPTGSKIAPTSTVAVGSAAGGLAPEVVLGLVAALVAVCVLVVDPHAVPYLHLSALRPTQDGVVRSPDKRSRKHHDKNLTGRSTRGWYG